ncbi:hypothetical protein FDP41_004393 [Naegleria fowleri]|uniref:Uncharacterized protein n=1 Tax=Naegleria fowleri TaxID=5763 RepID=A0A6A5BQR8_NAEFO|nr:uncharacterized protein FDP41_004393 [Naegleria fowleri]KAF0976494.1 hypothetical protein FDP41_004393 [Naegleria fowleri]
MSSVADHHQHHIRSSSTTSSSSRLDSSSLPDVHSRPSSQLDVTTPNKKDLKGLPSLRSSKTPESITLSYERDLRIETPKTEKAIFNTGEYGLVDLRFPNVRGKPQSAKRGTRRLLSAGTTMRRSMEVNNEYEIDYDSLEEELFSPELSSFTLSHNQLVESCWDYLQKTTLGSDQQFRQAMDLGTQYRKNAKENDIYDDIQNMILSMKCDEEKQEMDLENKKKKEQIKRKQKKNASVRKQVDERLKILYHNPDELERLEKDIYLYEKQTKEAEQDKKLQMVHVNRNKKVPENFRETRMQQLKEAFKRRNDKIVQAQEKKEKLTKEFQDRKENLALKDEKRRLLAEYNRQENENKAKDAELYSKWSFFVCLLSRFLIFARELLRRRYLRKEEEKFKRVKKISYTSLMPVIWAKRSQKWKQAWDVFKKHWIFYRLWIGVKKKKESTMIIKSFLRETNMSFQIVRQVHLFWSKVIKVQRFLRKWHQIKQMQIMIQVLQYSIVEAKMLRGIPLKGEVVEPPKKKKLPPNGVIPLNRRPSSQLSSPMLLREESKIAVTPSLDDTVDNLEREDKFRFRLLRLPLEIKKEIISSDLKQRRKEYITAQKIYKNKLQQYERRVQQLMYILQAKSALSGGATSIDPSSIRDENGEIIEKPKPPYLKVVLSELEMKRLVIIGNKRLKEIEDNERQRVLANYVEFSEKQNELDMFREEWELNVANGFDELKRVLGGSFFAHEQLLMAPFELFKKPESETPTGSSPISMHSKTPSLPRSYTNSPVNYLAKQQTKKALSKSVIPPKGMAQTKSVVNLVKR